MDLAFSQELSSLLLEVLLLLDFFRRSLVNPVDHHMLLNCFFNFFFLHWSGSYGGINLLSLFHSSSDYKFIKFIQVNGKKFNKAASALGIYEL